VLVTSASVLLDVVGNIRAGAVYSPPPPSASLLAWLAVAAAAYTVVAPRRRLALPAAICLAAMLMTRQAYGASWVWQQSYFRMYLVMPLVAAVACVPPALLHRRVIVAASAVVLVLGWLRLGYPIVAARSMEHREYRWAREQLRAVPAECRVAYLASAGHRVLRLPTYVAPSTSVAMDPSRPETIAAALSPAPCLYYVHGSLCSTREGRAACDALERRLTLLPVARASFPVAPTIETFSHQGETVETMIARVERVDGADVR
jgi:hypothetical protein